MIRTLPDDEVERLLREGFAGRLGCAADGQVYVVPIAYAYINGSIYSYAREGRKIRMMRKNPNVCFEIDRIDDEDNWRSVIAPGHYEELHGEAAEDAMRFILMKFLPSKARALAEPLEADQSGMNDPPAVIYRIRLTARTGRFRSSPFTSSSIESSTVEA